MAIIRVYQDSKGPGRCRTCGASITWAEQVNGKRHPFDGEIVAVKIEGGLLEGQRVIEHVDTSITTSHFATCPDAATHRRPRGR